ncbi:MAG: aminotransferase [Clostridia bacterium]|nr:aminotransferase [Clostridia bacterium]
MQYCKMSQEQLREELNVQKTRYDAYMAKGLSYDMTRGKPCTEQLDLSNGILDESLVADVKTEGGLDCRNYGVLTGIPEARALMGAMLGVPADQVIVGGNSSLNMMHDLLAFFMLHGTSQSGKPWCKEEKVKFICPVPGYDRHFGVTQSLGFELIPVDLLPDGPDMDRIEALVKSDASIKGMWSVPKYSNPTGYVYSDDCIRRLASMPTAADDFRIMWDDAYTIHFLGDAPVEQLNLIEACKEAGNPDRAIMIASTSKITFPGAGIAAIASSPANIAYFTKLLSNQTIGSDKMNQLRHVRFLKDREGLLAHMRKHADILRPKFQAVLEVFDREMTGLDILSWTKPEGGYFISIDVPEGCASKVVAMAKACGVAFTPAGATYPCGVDPLDRNIRIAPSFPPLSQIGTAIEVLCICIKICALEKLLNK